jgi:hypothetical protein
MLNWDKITSRFVQIYVVFVISKNFDRKETNFYKTIPCKKHSPYKIEHFVSKILYWEGKKVRWVYKVLTPKGQM